jgi:hypothetical protein
MAYPVMFVLTARSADDADIPLPFAAGDFGEVINDDEDNEPGAGSLLFEDMWMILEDDGMRAANETSVTCRSYQTIMATASARYPGITLVLDIVADYDPQQPKREWWRDGQMAGRWVAARPLPPRSPTAP